MQTSSFTYQEKVQNAFNRRGVPTVFGKLSKDGLNNEQCLIQRDETKPAIQSKLRGLLVNENTNLMQQT